VLFLIVVTIHCMLGLHSILLDLNLRVDVTRIITWFLVLIGTMTIIYGVWLTRVVVSF
jgi:succinate dehydrogenase hydrophobic anchor subunit